MKKKILILAALVLTLACVLSLGALTVSAEEAEPSVTIAKFNLAFEDNTYLKYAVRFDGVADEKITENNIGMLYWTDYADGFVPGTEDFSSKTTGYTEISGVKHYVFEYTHLAAKQLTDYIYSVAYLEYEGEVYYSAPVKYSALEYAYNRLGKTSEGSSNTELKSLLNNMLAYGASAQQYFDYKEDRLATDDFYQLTLVGGTLADGFTSGLYLSTDKVTITAPEITEAGNSFVSWIDESGFVVSESREFTASDIKKNSVYSVLDSSMVAPSREGLEYTVNADGVSCTITGLGTYSDTEVYIPEYIDDYKVTAIGEKAFANETTLAKIVLPETTETIGTRAFYGCTGLTEMTIPTSVTSIGIQIFYKASNLNTVYYNSTYSDSNNPFLNTVSIKKVVFGGNYVPDYILSGCTNILEVTILDGVIGIDNSAFNGCSSITDIKIPDSITYISEHSFEECSSLSNVMIGNGVMSIGDNAFRQCDSLTNIVIGDGVKSIGDDAFRDCIKLSSITFGSNIEWIGYYRVFSGCNSIENVYITDITKWCEIHFADWESNPLHSGAKLYLNNELVTKLIIPDNVTSIGKHAFYNCESITDIVIPDSVTSINKSAFAGCSSITSIAIPDSVTSIGDYAFERCSALTSIVIPDSVTSIGGGAFSSCYKLVEVINLSSLNLQVGSGTYGQVAYYAKEVHSDESKIANVNDHLFYTYEGVNYLLGYVGDDIELTLPENYNCENYEIYEFAFYGSSSLTSIVIPGSVTSIGDYAFEDCSSLASVVIGNSVTSIGYFAFENCTSLTSVVIPDSVTSIGDYAFEDCSSLTSVVISHSVTSIGNYAFYNCSSLTSIEIPNNVANIGDKAFSGCSSLTSVVISDSVISIGNYAFEDCSSLTSIVIPDSVTSMGSHIFFDCSSLTVYCEASSQPSEWSAGWHIYSSYGYDYSVLIPVWGYK